MQAQFSASLYLEEPASLHHTYRLKAALLRHWSACYTSQSARRGQHPRAAPSAHSPPSRSFAHLSTSHVDKGLNVRSSDAMKSFTLARDSRMGVVDFKTVGLTRRMGSVLFTVTALYCCVYLFVLFLPSHLGSGVSRWGAPGTLLSGSVSAINNLAAGTDGRQPTVGKVSMLYGNPDPIYVRALASHEAHASQHGYPMYILREPLIEGIWSKLAYLQAVITAELSRPADQRLKWLFWFDADTYVVNPNIPLEAFLPPDDDPAFRNISFLGGHDHRGLNAGVLMFRIDQTALHLMTSALALPRYRPDLKLKFAEQTALELILGTPDSVFPASSHPGDDLPDVFTQRSAIVPQRWFNAYMGERAWNGTRWEDIDGKPRKTKANSVKLGDLLVHFAGHSEHKKDRMTTFINTVEQDPSIWVRPFAETGLEDETRRFWLRWKAEQRSERKQKKPGRRT